MPETLIDSIVTYTLDHEGKIYIVEHVPARVSEQTGEQCFAPETVERIIKLISEKTKPDRIAETPVDEYRKSVSRRCTADGSTAHGVLSADRLSLHRGPARPQAAIRGDLRSSGAGIIKS